MRGSFGALCLAAVRPHSCNIFLTQDVKIVWDRDLLVNLSDFALIMLETAGPAGGPLALYETAE